MKGLFGKKVPIIMQAEAAECGAASLAMILGYYGRYIELKQLRKECKVSRDGSKLKYIMEAAQSHGMSVRAMRCPPDMKDIKLPAIAFWKGYHFLVVEKISEDKVTLCDPELGRREVTMREFAGGFTGFALELMPAEGFKRFGKPFRMADAIMPFIKGNPQMIIYMIILSVMLNVVGVLIPLFIRLFTDVYLPSRGRVGSDHFLTLYFVILVLQASILLLQNVMQRFFTRQFCVSMSITLLKKLLRSPLYFFQERARSSLIEYLTSTDALAKFISSQLVPMLIGIMLSMVYFVMMFCFSPLIAISVLVVTVIILLVMMKLIRINRARIISSINQRIALLGNVMQTVTIFDSVKSTGQEAAARQRVLAAYASFRNSNQGAATITTYIQALPVMMPLLMQTVVLGIGIPSVMNNGISIGTLLALESLAVSFIGPLLQFVGQFIQLEAMAPQVRAVCEIEQEDDDPLVIRKSSSDTPAGTDKTIHGDISIKNVTFGYNPTMPPVLNDINIEIPQGKSVAIVGGSGSGKSTLIKLIQGLYSPWEGQIEIDHVPLKDTDRALLSEKMTVAPQTMSFFTGTIRDNITMFDRRIGTSQYVKAADDAYISDMIGTLPKGYHTMLDSRAQSLSGGQRQRIMLARALVHDPRILIMDEATSALDTLAEKQIMDNIGSRNITRIIVAHRLSAIRDCDEIIVLDKGHIVQRGKHEQLMEEEGLYKKLVLTEEE